MHPTVALQEHKNRIRIVIDNMIHDPNTKPEALQALRVLNASCRLARNTDDLESVCAWIERIKREYTA